MSSTKSMTEMSDDGRTWVHRNDDGSRSGQTLFGDDDDGAATLSWKETPTDDGLFELFIRANIIEPLPSAPRPEGEALVGYSEEWVPARHGIIWTRTPEESDAVLAHVRESLRVDWGRSNGLGLAQASKAVTA